jgi:phage terminase large subunit
MAGVHAPHVLLVGDEASGIPEAVFEAAIGSMSGENAITLLAGNGVRRTGFFYKTHTDPEMMLDWRRIHISCVGHPRISPDFIRQVAVTYGERSNAYRVRVLGEFPLADDDTVIPYEIAEAALKRDVKPLLVAPIWGLDCARFGSDSSALAKRRGNTTLGPIQEKHGLDTMELTGWLKSEYDSTAAGDRPSEINVDVIGLGAGVVDRGRELGLPIRGINVGEAPALKGEYVNQRAELWFRGREFLERRDCNLSGDEKLVAELVGPKYRFSSNGKKQVESKDEMKKRGLPSPNRADAFLLTLASEAIAASQGSSTSTNWKTPLKRGIKGLA